MLGELLTVVALALLPASGNFAGGLVAEWARPSRKALNHALHGAAGVMLAVIAVEVMPQALRGAQAWALALAFMAGGGIYLLVKARVESWQKAKEAGAGAGAWMIYVGVTADLLGDGLLIGAGSAVSRELGIALAIGQVLADIPEGFAVIANFRDKGVSRAKRLLLSASFVLPVVAAAVVAYLVLRGQSEPVKMVVLVAVAGLYTLAAVEDMLREAHESAEDGRGSAVAFLAGFALFLMVSGGLA